jgi:hypothetical protein
MNIPVLYSYKSIERIIRFIVEFINERLML